MSKLHFCVPKFDVCVLQINVCFFQIYFPAFHINVCVLRLSFVSWNSMPACLRFIYASLRWVPVLCLRRPLCPRLMVIHFCITKFKDEIRRPWQVRLLFFCTKMHDNTGHRNHLHTVHNTLLARIQYRSHWRFSSSSLTFWKLDCTIEGSCRHQTYSFIFALVEPTLVYLSTPLPSFSLFPTGTSWKKGCMTFSPLSQWILPLTPRYFLTSWLHTDLTIL